MISFSLECCHCFSTYMSKLFSLEISIWTVNVYKLTIGTILLACFVKVQNDIIVCYNNNPMLLLMDNSDSPSIVEQLSQGPGLVYNTFIDNSS